MNFSQSRSRRILLSDSQMGTDYASSEKGTQWAEILFYYFQLNMLTFIQRKINCVDRLTNESIGENEKIANKGRVGHRVSGVVVWSFSLANVAVIFPRKVCGV